MLNGGPIRRSEVEIVVNRNEEYSAREPRINDHRNEARHFLEVATLAEFALFCFIVLGLEQRAL